jgi:hypothetical protein
MFSHNEPSPSRDLDMSSETISSEASSIECTPEVDDPATSDISAQYTPNALGTAPIGPDTAMSRPAATDNALGQSVDQGGLVPPLHLGPIRNGSSHDNHQQTSLESDLEDVDGCNHVFLPGSSSQAVSDIVIHGTSPEISNPVSFSLIESTNAQLLHRHPRPLFPRPSVAGVEETRSSDPDQLLFPEVTHDLHIKFAGNVVSLDDSRNELQNQYYRAPIGWTGTQYSTNIQQRRLYPDMGLQRKKGYHAELSNLTK